MIISHENIVFGDFVISLKKEQFTYKSGRTCQALIVEVYKDDELVDDLYIPLGEVKNG